MIFLLLFLLFLVGYSGKYATFFFFVLLFWGGDLVQDRCNQNYGLEFNFFASVLFCLFFVCLYVCFSVFSVAFLVGCPSVALSV